ncbi:SPARC-like protein 1 [Dendrobates tinctorius]|uniref:SPARC-like protein 1 n=1 Tax=Dendrobates tinctorius TaxID=92724 RepID=UPI003CCA0785
MYYFVLLASLVCFTSPGASLIVEHGLTSEPELNEDMKEQKHAEKAIIDQYATADLDASMESIIDSKLSEQADNSKTEAGTFSLESFLNLFRVGIDGPPSLDGKDNKTNISEKKNEGYAVNVIDEVDMKMQKEHKSESQESKSDDQQSQELSSDRLSVQYVGNVGNTSTFLHINNDTDEKLYIEEPSPYDIIDIKDLKTAINIKEEAGNADAETFRDDKTIKKEKLIKEENGGKTQAFFSDLVSKQKESDVGEQQNQHLDNIVNNNRIKGDMPHVDSIKMTTNDKNDNDSTAFPQYLENIGKLQDVNVSIQEKEGSLEKYNVNLSTDQCNNFQCKRGKICKTDGHGVPFCVCEDPVSCLPGNRNDFVCGTDNKTYTSACHLFGTKCLLEGTKEGNRLHLDYEGPCKYIPTCTGYELTHFPIRMRDWLKNVLMQLYERDKENTGLLSEKQKSKVKKIYDNEKRLLESDHNIELLVKDFQKNYNMYVYPVHWQFHQLDQHLVDRLLTHSELAALRDSLTPIEHCVKAFLQECNSNNDRHISLWEWCHCFGIKEGDINEDLLF